MKSSSFEFHPCKKFCGNNPTKTIYFLMVLPFCIFLALFLLSSPVPIYKQLFFTRPSHHQILVIPKVEDSCDLFSGGWVWDLEGPIYTNSTCPTLPDSKNCGKHGRIDTDYMKWRWKPDSCELPRFDPKRFLNLFRHKKLVFVGDSVARNQMESLLCLLSQVETPTDIYHDHDDRFRRWHFPSHNFVLAVFWTKFLVHADEIIRNGLPSGEFNIHLDRPDANWTRSIAQYDVAVISDAHWFFRPSTFYESGHPIGCLYCDSNKRKLKDLGLAFALRKAFHSALRALKECDECKGLYFVRTFSPAHFEHGSWNEGGRCNRTEPLGPEGVSESAFELEVREIQVHEVKKVSKVSRDKRIKVLDVTKAMMVRPDGHPNEHWHGPEMEAFNDCIHWCLPGPVDAWNELLMEMVARERSKE
ncbi:hypothetical protein AMTRI_Chr10g230660 [Amborella trichopoda]|uniref:Uncharacterized protein n=1 Tax=Amborella trichopoda TaxID=13333 RepID=W1NWB0_AMBTC|nr:protein ALTERED XYLOGLUCAN 4-like [Amborella trichopoda]ERM99565.1 hypothetical protein AMTR_s00088p00114920 [Amborella trichopoda]|eukprot:XP_020518921.1 protein ALTERED XYLOGLUCAN 4-like [Amborella trichopoda]